MEGKLQNTKDRVGPLKWISRYGLKGITIDTARPRRKVSMSGAGHDEKQAR